MKVEVACEKLFEVVNANHMKCVGHGQLCTSFYLGDRGLQKHSKKVVKIAVARKTCEQSSI